jgi:hypothetical protein
VLRHRRSLAGRRSGPRKEAGARMVRVTRSVWRISAKHGTRV